MALMEQEVEVFLNHVMRTNIANYVEIEGMVDIHFYVIPSRPEHESYGSLNSVCLRKTSS